MNSDPLYQSMMNSKGRGGGIRADKWFALGSSWGSQVGGV